MIGRNYPNISEEYNSTDNQRLLGDIILMKDSLEGIRPFSLLSRNFICICLSSFLYFGSFYLFALPVLPQFVAWLGGTTSQIGLVTGFFTMMSVITRPYFGKLADKYGRKK